MRIGYSVAVAGVAAALLASPASAVTVVNFTASVSVTDALVKPDISYTSIGLTNTAVDEFGVTIADFITATFEDNAFENPGPGVSTITATFTFTPPPTPSGATSAGGSITGLKTQPPNAVSSVTIDWAPAIFTFTDGTKLLVSLEDTTYVCGTGGTNANNCNGQTFTMDGFFQLQEPGGQTSTTPLPAAAWLFGTVIAGGAGVSRWRKRRQAKMTAA